MVRLICTSLLLLFMTLGFSIQLQAESKIKGQFLTLVAEISVSNETDVPIHNYVHRVAAPVPAHFQQELLGIRHESVDRFERKPFEYGAGDYVELEWDIPEHSLSVKKVYFDLRVNSYIIPTDPASLKWFPKENFPPDFYLKPSRFIESDAVEILHLAQVIQQKHPDAEARLRAAYLAPQKLIRYERQSTRGALYALTERKGDCTEYAALFVALARAMGHPARMTSDFLFTEKRTFAQPNHHAAEVYLHGQWIPVDPNLALDPKFGYGFGVGAQSKIVLNRNSEWVWSNLWPQDIKNRRGKVGVTMHWHIVESREPKEV